jgi:sugar/nucleoside kinase (ribokinase family)
MSPRIATLGDVVLDVVVTGDIETARDARGGVRLAPGGSAANFAAIAARGGAHVTFFGVVGDDAAGRLLVAELEREGVVPRVRVAAGAATGNILVLVGSNAASRMISDPGASALLAPEDVDPRVLAAAALVHVSGYSWLREGPDAAAREAVRCAREGDAIVTFDPGPAHLIRAYGGARLIADVAEARFDVLFPNLEEGTAMTGKAEPSAILAALGAAAPLVVLKLGADGCLLASRGRVDHVPAVPARVIDTTGAGDAFAAAFAVAYATTRDPLAAAQAGAIAGASAVSRLGAR